MTDDNEQSTEVQVPATVETITEPPREEQFDLTIVAQNPAEMAAAQQSMIAWAGHKVEAEQALLVETQQNLEIAKKSKWKFSHLLRMTERQHKTVDFYTKIKLALDEGYYIVPPFPIDIFAIRTARKNPLAQRNDQHWGKNQPSQILPAGEGRYVSNEPLIYADGKTMVKNYKGEIEEKTAYKAGRFDTVEFPFKLAKPAVMNAMAHALALKVFDQLGVLPGHQNRRNPDPIICGQILKPTQFKEPVTFFIAWWINTATI